MRHRSRHVLQSVVQHLKTQLTALNWNTTTGFNEHPVNLVAYMVDEKDTSIPPNTVAVNFGDESDEVGEELGDGLVSSTWVVFVDVYGENQAVALALADDIKDVFRGRINGLRPYLQLTDFTAVPPTVTMDLLEFDGTERSKPLNNDYRRNWQVVKTTVTCYWNPSE